jgi:alanyl-tRNA synthetase
VGVVAELMSDTYPELTTRRTHIERTTRAEEERFLDTIEAGMDRFEEVAPEGGTGTIPGSEAFKLYDTFGFPLDLTELMASERGYEVDREGFDEALELQRQRSRSLSGWLGSSPSGDAGGLTEEVLELARGVVTDADQEFVGYDRLRVETKVLEQSSLDGMRALLLAENPFYVEAGGQVSDSGYLRGEGWELAVESVVRNERGQAVVLGEPTHGQVPEAPHEVLAVVEEHMRRDTERNHTATHLLHAALRAVLGEHVHQAGSLVAPDRLRFDFTHHGPLTPVERSRIERLVNEAIWANKPLEIEHRPYREALDAGAMALFGEKYGDVVRTVSVPGVSLELCGGCHVRSTGQIGMFRIASETGVAAGVRRLEAVTGPRAYARLLDAEGMIADLAERLRVAPTELPGRVSALIEERDQLEGSLAEQRGADAESMATRLVEEAEPLGEEGGRLVRASVALPAGSDIAAFGDRLRAGLGSGAAVIHVHTEDGKDAILAVVTDDWIGRGLRAGDLVRTASRATGSGGGGKPHLAQGGVGDPTRLGEALEEAAALARSGASGQ